VMLESSKASGPTLGRSLLFYHRFYYVDSRGLLIFLGLLSLLCGNKIIVEVIKVLNIWLLV
jgi:hypothetical protein